MKLSFLSDGWLWLRPLLVIALSLNGVLLSPSVARADITQFVAGMTGSGTPTWDALDNDSVTVNTDIRTNDYATYRVGFTVTPQDTNALLKLEIGSFTLPGTYTGPALTQVAYFSVADLPTGTNGCQNISTSPVSNPPPAGVSGVTADGQTLFCWQPSPASGNNQDFRMQIRGDAPNGTIVQPPTITFSSTNNPATSAVTPLSGAIGATTYYGLPPLTIRAAPRWDLWKTYPYEAGTFVPGSGPAGEDGYVFVWQLRILARGSRKGLEALQSPVTINDSFVDPDFPNAQFMSWSASNAGVPFNTSPNHCENAIEWAGLVTDRVPPIAPYSVANGGVCQATAWDNTAKTVAFTLTGTDFSLRTYPTNPYYTPNVFLVDPAGVVR